MAKTRITVPFFIAHLGCPHRCVFCDQRRTAGPVHPPSPHEIADTVHRYLSKMGPHITRAEIAFFGGTFTGLPEKLQRDLLAAAGSFVRSGEIQGIRVSTRPDLADQRALAMLADHGVTTVELGAQSFSDRVLEASLRGHCAADTVAASRRIREAGLDLVLQLMPGLPGDCRGSSLDSARTAASLGPAAVRIYPTVVIRGTGLDSLYRQGRYRPLDLDEAVEVCKEMTLILNHSGIEVIRTGLHPLREEEMDSITAGPYHPAFGFMVKSRIKRDMLEQAMMVSQGLPRGDRCTLLIPEREKEEYLGHRRINIGYLRERFGYTEVIVKTGAVTEPRVLI